MKGDTSEQTGSQSKGEAHERENGSSFEQKFVTNKTRGRTKKEAKFKDGVEQLHSQKQPTLRILHTRKDAMMKRRTQVKMDRLDGLMRK